MTDLEQEFYAYLRQVPAVVAVLSADGKPESTRLFPEVSPQSAAYPRASFQRVTDIGLDHMGGASPLSHAMIQTDVFAKSPADRKTTANAIRNALHGAQGFFMGEVAVRSVRLENEIDSATYISDGTDVPVYRTRMDFSIWYVRSAPVHTL